MKKLFFLFAFFFITALSFAQSQVWVKGYTRNNGTYVQGHWRTVQNHTKDDNWTTVGNVNPYTGKHGYLDGDNHTKRKHNSSRKTVIDYRDRDIKEMNELLQSMRNSTTSHNLINNNLSHNNLSTSFSLSSSATTPYSDSKTLYTGPRGGTYYINSNGNKSYVR